MATKDLEQSINSWFAKYDALSKAADVEGMANMAMFPVHVITDDSAGNGVAEDWNRGDFIHTMTAAMEGMPPDLDMKARRTPFFLTDNLAVVITDAKITMGGQETQMRYADVLVKVKGEWKFQTMAQGGWGDMLRERAGKFDE